jgi:hypothetical protein
MIAMRQVAAAPSADRPAAEARPGAFPTAEEVSRASGIRYVYFTLMSHQNPSFNAPQDDVEMDYKEIVDKAILLCDQHPDLRWTIEGIWQLEWWLRQTPDREQVDRLARLVREGRIAISASYVNEDCHRLGAEDTNRFLLPAMQMAERLGVKLDLAVMAEVRGWSWALPQVFAQNGIRYFFTPMGWAISGGACKVPRSDMPFWWEGLAGERVLTWVQQELYAWPGFIPNLVRFFEGRTIQGTADSLGRRFAGRTLAEISDEEIMDGRLAELLESYQEEGYRRDAILVSFSQDNLSPDLLLGVKRKFIDGWNARHQWPKVILATPTEFFKHMEEKYGDDFPVHRGDWSGAWSGGGPRCRRARNMLATAETLWAIESGLGLPRSPRGGFDDLYRVYFPKYRAGIFAGGQMRDPLVMLRRNQNARRNLWEFRARTASLYHQAADRLANAVGLDEPSVLVFNPVPWRRTEPVAIHVSEEQFKEPFLLVDPSNGSPVPLEKDGESSSITFLAPDLPPLGYKLFAFRRGDSAPPAAAIISSDTSIETGEFRVSVHPQSGAIVSLFDKRLCRELIDTVNPESPPASALLQASHLDNYLGKPPGPVDLGRAEIRSVVRPLTRRLLVRRPGTPLPLTEIVLVEGADRVLVTNVVDLSVELTRTLAEGTQLFIGFPWNLDGKPEARCEAPNSFLRAGDPATHLVGAHQRVLGSQHGFDFRSQEQWGILYVSRDVATQFFNNGSPVYSPDFDLDRMTVLTPVGGIGRRDRLATGAFDFDKISVPSELEVPDDSWPLQFAIAGRRGPFDEVATMRFGWNVNFPPIARLVPAVRPNVMGQKSPPLLPESALSFFQVDPENVVVTVVKEPSFGDRRNGDLLVRLQEMAGRATPDVTLRTFFGYAGVELDTLAEKPSGKQPLSTSPLRLSMKPNETVTVRLKNARRP